MANVRNALRYGTFGLILALAGGCFAAARPQEPQSASPDSKDSNADDKPRKKDKPDNPREKPQRDKDDTPDPSGASRSLGGLAKDVVHDQKRIWSSPARLRFADADWLVPASGFVAGLFVTDADVSLHLSNNPQTISHYKTYSTAGVGALIGAGAGLFLLSYPTHNEHWRETGLLAGEAAVDSLIPIEMIKYTLGRQRPYQGDGTGPFFQGGTSFPSEHAAAAWAIAGVFAHEYPGIFPKILSYGLASFVSYSRIKGKQHFPSDVFVGSMIGQLVSQSVYSHHHDPSLGGDEWRSIGQIVRGDGHLTKANQGSPYVPLDSWIYPALDRLAALGLIDSSFAAMRPWTRSECARLANEAADQASNLGQENHVQEGLIEELQAEFRPENDESEGNDGPAFRLESVYSRTEHISGMPLHDGYNFAQTQINDFGRPYGQGWSTANGLSAYTTWGRWVAYLRGELQTAPEVPALSLTARQTVQVVDGLNQVPPGSTQPSSIGLKMLDAYVGLMLSNWQVTFGRQSLWWGPGEGTPLMFSDNAAPINMFRINRVSPFKLPSIFGWLGPLRVEIFLGQLRGQHFIFGQNTGLIGSFTTNLNPQPMINGQRFTFKPTKNFEFGFSRTGLFAGPGVPFTLGTLEKSVFNAGNGLPGTSTDPGDRRSGVDWSYRLPRLRDWLTFYGDAFSDDQFSPIAYLDRSAIRGGLFLSHMPGFAKLDLRVEGVYTDVPAGGNLSHGFFYSNDRYRSGYTSDGYLLGSWIGRQGQGAQAWTNYWFNPRSRLEFNFRHQKVSHQFISGGGSLTDVGVRGDYQMTSNVSLSAAVQYERWLFPVIQPGATTDVSATVEVLFQPRRLLRHSNLESASGNGDLP
jgi:Capsule assembly protein Wzi/PAP2 superfamily